MLDALFAEATTANVMTIPPGWAQGRATYGGLVAGLLCRRLFGLVGEERVLRSATMSFVGPVVPGEVTLTAEILRSGKSVTQAEARLLQDGVVQAVLLASFGAPRDSQLVVSPPACDLPSPETARVMPYLPGLMPEFLQHMDMRLCTGQFPFTGSAVPDFSGWMRFRQPPSTFGISQLFALIDCWPPSVLPMLRAPAPASSLCWTLEFLHFPPEATGESFWHYDVRTDACADGYAHAEARVRDDQGRLVAISRQTMTVFA